MPRLKPRPAREICGILSQHGFEQVRQSGSHIVMQAHRENEFDQETTISVVVPNKSEIPVGTISSIIKHSKLPRKFFELRLATTARSVCEFKVATSAKGVTGCKTLHIEAARR